MPQPGRKSDRRVFPNKRSRAARPAPEALESRLLLYSKLGDQWTYDSRITYSFMPDGTSIGGVPSVLFQTLNQNNSTSAWQQQIKEAASLWENSSNINLALVSDGGEPVGTSGNQQDDPRFGDIRIGAIPLGPGVLAETFLPPPANGGTDAGDIILNSSINWQINNNYDVMTVMAHEFGHALGLGDSTVAGSVMYGTYSGIDQSLSSDDQAGIQSVYGARQFDIYNNAGKRDNTYMTATNINSTINSSSQIAIPGLDITTAGDSEWFYVNVPASTSGTMSVSVQSSNLSSLSPEVQVYSSALSLVGQASAQNSMGATVSVSNISVKASQGFYIKVMAAGGPGPIGGYGLLVNFGSPTQAPIAPPNTVVAQQPDQGSGSINNAVMIVGPTDAGGSSSQGPLPVFARLGSLSGWAEILDVSAPAPIGPSTPPVTQPVIISPVTVTPTTNIPVLVPPVATAPTAPLTTTNTSHPKGARLKLLKWEARHRVNHAKQLITIKDHHHDRG
jgi:hypothetical protein